MHTRSARFCLLTTLLLGMSACSTEGTLTPVSGGGTAMTAANIWSIDVTGTEPARADEIRNSVLESLIGSSLAQHVVLPGTPADRVLVIHVTRIRYVSAGERMMLGLMAGRNVVEATETVSSPLAPAGQTMKVFTVEAESAAHPLAGVSMFEDALKTFAEKTLDGLRS